jgi:hypothetical protein
MSWQHALELMALGVILVCGVALYVEEVRERRKFLPKPQPDSRFNSMRDFH